MNQQRSRRFRSARDAIEARAAAQRRGEPAPEGEPFDSNCITPGTPFMARLSEHLHFFVRKQQTSDPAWQRMTVILSGHEVRACTCCAMCCGVSHHLLCARRCLARASTKSWSTCAGRGRSPSASSNTPVMSALELRRFAPRSYEPNQRHCLYGLDADLIMLALVSHEPHFCLLREVVKFGGGGAGQPSREVLENPSEEGFQLLQVRPCGADAVS